MIYTKIDSSMIDLVGYDADSETLEVRFVSSGLTYEYEDIPKGVYKNLMNASSKGSYMRGIIEMYSGSKVKSKRKTSRPKKDPFDKYVGDYIITNVFEFDLDDDDWLSIEAGGVGKFCFAGIEGIFSGVIEEDEGEDKDEMLVIKWHAGNSKKDLVEGTGFFILDDERTNIEGRISFKCGKDHYLCAEKEEED